MGEPKPEPPERDAEARLRAARAIAEGITDKNWYEKKAALLALLNATAENGQTPPEAGN